MRERIEIRTCTRPRAACAGTRRHPSFEGSSGKVLPRSPRRISDQEHHELGARCRGWAAPSSTRPPLAPWWKKRDRVRDIDGRKDRHERCDKDFRGSRRGSSRKQLVRLRLAAVRSVQLGHVAWTLRVVATRSGEDDVHQRAIEIGATCLRDPGEEHDDRHDVKRSERQRVKASKHPAAFR